MAYFHKWVIRRFYDRLSRLKNFVMDNKMTVQSLTNASHNFEMSMSILSRRLFFLTDMYGTGLLLIKG